MISNMLLAHAHDSMHGKNRKQSIAVLELSYAAVMAANQLEVKFACG